MDNKSEAFYQGWILYSNSREDEQWDRSWCVLTDQRIMLRSSDDPQSSSIIYSLKLTASCSLHHGRGDNTTGYQFYLAVATRRVLTFKVKTSQEREQWIDRIHQIASVPPKPTPRGNKSGGGPLHPLPHPSPSRDDPPPPSSPPPSPSPPPIPCSSRKNSLANLRNDSGVEDYLEPMSPRDSNEPGLDYQELAPPFAREDGRRSSQQQQQRETGWERQSQKGEGGNQWEDIRRQGSNRSQDSGRGSGHFDQYEKFLTSRPPPPKSTPRGNKSGGGPLHPLPHPSPSRDDPPPLSSPPLSPSPPPIPCSSRKNSLANLRNDSGVEDYLEPMSPRDSNEPDYDYLELSPPFAREDGRRSSQQQQQRETGWERQSQKGEGGNQWEDIRRQGSNRSHDSGRGSGHFEQYEKESSSQKMSRKNPTWLFESCSRTLGEKILRECDPRFGNTLMRSTSLNPGYSISKRLDTQRKGSDPVIEHFKVIYVSGGYRFDVDDFPQIMRSIEEVMAAFVQQTGAQTTLPMTCNDLNTLGVSPPDPHLLTGHSFKGAYSRPPPLPPR
ncbi:hypothetical protein ACOMHN_006956 [Nucella lapillus]